MLWQYSLVARRSALSRTLRLPIMRILIESATIGGIIIERSLLVLQVLLHPILSGPSCILLPMLAASQNQPGVRASVAVVRNRG
jgi:hypothetical protein